MAEAVVAQMLARIEAQMSAQNAQMTAQGHAIEQLLAQQTAMTSRIDVGDTNVQTAIAAIESRIDSSVVTRLATMEQRIAEHVAPVIASVTAIQSQIAMATPLCRLLRRESQLPTRELCQLVPHPTRGWDATLASLPGHNRATGAPLALLPRTTS
jgi:hypothetical protein